MKKTLLLLTIALSALSVSAQKDSKAIGLHLNYGGKVENLGIGVKGQYFATDNVRFEASIDHFFKRNNLSMWGINANVHYVINLGDKFRFYPLAGLAYTNWSLTYETEKSGKTYVETDHSHRIGLNLGVGCEYDLGRNTFASFEIKDQVLNNYGQVVASLGVGYRF